jgi:hypothetical protein
LVTGPGVDLLGDGLVQVENAEAPKEPGAIEPTTQANLPARNLGPCSVCQEKPGQERCVHCEKPACREHYWVMLGLCKVCATEDEMKAAREGAHRKRPDLEIKWIED